ncbi:MAG: phosphatidylglycerol lysyltransferase domain-containing protein [Bacteroidales bacterium]
MLNFRDITLEDKNWIDELLQYSDYMSTEYCFTSLYTWRNIYRTQVCRYKDFVLIRSEGSGVPNYLFPAGRGSDADIQEMMDLYSRNASSLGHPMILAGVLNTQKELLERLYPNKFSFELTRNSFDYMYLAEDLISLRGKKFQSKRNHIARFRELPDWSYEPLSAVNLPECEKMNGEWCAKYGCNHDLSMVQEACSVRCAIHHFEQLQLKGGLLRLAGKVVAFTIGELLNSNTMIIHVEKAFADIKGAYPAISQEFLSHQMQSQNQIGFQYVNREDDAGDRGLRTAKMQYNPVFLLEKWTGVAGR